MRIYTYIYICLIVCKDCVSQHVSFIRLVRLCQDHFLQELQYSALEQNPPWADCCVHTWYPSFGRKCQV